MIFNVAEELEKFKYNLEIRNEVKKEFGIDSKIVIGHIGRLCYQKNQEFLIDVFERVYKRNENAVLLLAGDGPDREKIERRIKLSPAAKNIVFPGSRDDPERLYQAMDVFVLPSRYEGFPAVAVEAQAAGLPCVLSNNITREVMLTEQVRFTEINAGTDVWANEILKQIECIHNNSRDAVTVPREYDITAAAEKLENYYIRLIQA